MAAALTLCVAATGCGQPAPLGAGEGATAPDAGGPAVPLRVTNNGAPFANFEGAAAKRLAAGLCAARGLSLRSSIDDRFEAGEWVFVRGCA